MARGRKLEFDPNDALAAVTEVFWCQGFEGTTFDDLVRKTGVQRYGLYEKIGDKETAFEKALELYVEKIITDFTASLRSPNAGLDQIEAFFERLIDLNKETPRGCMVCNAIASPMREEENVRGTAEKMLKILECSFRNCLEQGKKSGELTPEADVDKMVPFLLGVVAGSITLSRFPDGGTVAECFMRESLSMMRRQT